MDQPGERAARRLKEKRSSSLRRWTSNLKRDVMALWIAARDPRVAWPAKALAAAIAAYALSPIDLIPDFIPVLGLLDDLLIVPFGIWLVLRMIPPPLMTEFRAAAVDQARPRSRATAVVIVALWMLASALAAWHFWPRR